MDTPSTPVVPPPKNDDGKLGMLESENSFLRWTNRFILLGLVGAVLYLFIQGFTHRVEMTQLRGQVENLASLNTGLASVQTEVSNLKAANAQLTAHTAKLDDLRLETQRVSSDSNVLAQKASDFVTEIDSLRAKVGAGEVATGKFETIINTLLLKVAALEQKTDNACGQISTLKERLARLEAMAGIRESGTPPVAP